MYFGRVRAVPVPDLELDQAGVRAPVTCTINHILRILTHKESSKCVAIQQGSFTFAADAFAPVVLLGLYCPVAIRCLGVAAGHGSGRVAQERASVRCGVRRVTFVESVCAWVAGRGGSAFVLVFLASFAPFRGPTSAQEPRI